MTTQLELPLDVAPDVYREYDDAIVAAYAAHADRIGGRIVVTWHEAAGEPFCAIAVVDGRQDYESAATLGADIDAAVEQLSAALGWEDET